MSAPDDLIDKLRDCATDPMWIDHAEVPKSLLREAIDELRRVKDAPTHEIVLTSTIKMSYGDVRYAKIGHGLQIETAKALGEFAGQLVRIVPVEDET